MFFLIYFVFLFHFPFDMRALRWFQHSTLRTVEGEKRAWQMAQEQSEAGGEEEYASRLELCQRTGVPPVETLIRERRVAWAVHALRNRREACHYLVREEIRKRTPWGRMLQDDFEAVALPLEGILEMEKPPAATAIKSHLVTHRPTKPLPKERKGDNRGKTKACKEKTKRQSENIQRQREEAQRQMQDFIAEISGRRWERVPSAGGKYWQTTKTDDDPTAVQFEIEAEDFCESTGREEYRVCGVWFQKMSDGTYAARAV
ncbi:unnamed protein product [Amoebophrya sp. A120]|nr:unnamed protein product [Amoebophrya sp. A120]|eukprot:GSA120T00018193001.1